MLRFRKLLDYGAQSSQEQVDVIDSAAATHEPDSPDFSGEVSESATNFDVILVEQFGADQSVVEAGWEFNCVEHGQAIFGGDDKLKAQLFEPVAKQEMIPAVAFEAGIESLF